MSNCLKARSECRHVAKMLARSVLSDDWTVTNDGTGPATLTRKEFAITIETARLRVFDRLRVKFRDCELWFPLVARICLRNSVRWRLAVLAAIELEQVNA